MNPTELRLAPGSPVAELAQAIADSGGRLVVVGGWVRDQLVGRASKDLDAEVFGLERPELADLLDGLGFTPPVGRRFAVWRLPRAALDISFPRAGADAFTPADPSSRVAAFRMAARHRDLTINAIGWDPLDGALIDPWQGVEALAEGRLVAVDQTTFGADPLRVLRLARFHAVLDASIDPSLHTLASGIFLGGLPPERVAGELQRILLDAPRPSQAFECLDGLGQLGIFDLLLRLKGVDQDPQWHPEGDVFVHTMMAIDRAAEIARAELEDDEDRAVLLWAALCHDLGKPQTTTEEAGRIRSIGHERVGARLTREWLEALRIAKRRIDAIEVLVAEHLVPSQLVGQGAGAKAYRRLARRLECGRVTVVELERLARADHLGRTTEEAHAGRYEAGPRFLAAAEAAGVAAGVRADLVEAAAWLERGVQPGPELGALLARCREVQDELGWTDPERIIEHVQRERDASAGRGSS